MFLRPQDNFRLQEHIPLLTGVRDFDFVAELIKNLLPKFGRILQGLR